MSAAAKRNTEVKLYLEEMMDAMCTNDKEQNERNIELLVDQIYENIKHQQEQNEQRTTLRRTQQEGSFCSAEESIEED